MFGSMAAATKNDHKRSTEAMLESSCRMQATLAMPRLLLF
jgi:hypothetical protein